MDSDNDRGIPNIEGIVFPNMTDTPLNLTQPCQMVQIGTHRLLGKSRAFVLSVRLCGVLC